MSKDSLGDRIKSYERAAESRLMPQLPVIARLDGKNFSGFTRDMERPYDHSMTMSMINTAMMLARETDPKIVYTQSDEITLVWYAESYKTEMIFGGRIQKMASVLAGMATRYFGETIHDMLPPKYSKRRPVFDCRVFAVPNLDEAANAVLWRELDATRNSVSMAASSVYSHKELHKKNQANMMDMLMEKGINWNDYPPFFKRGVFIQRRSKVVEFTPEELEAMSPKAQKMLEGKPVERSAYERIDMPSFRKVTNRVGVIFNAEKPETDETTYLE